MYIIEQSSALLSVGVEEDFKAWKDGFVKNVLPVLLGEVAMSELTSASSAVGEGNSCECGGKRKKECCKEKSNEQVNLSDHRVVYYCIARKFGGEFNMRVRNIGRF